MRAEVLIKLIAPGTQRHIASVKQKIDAEGLAAATHVEGVGAFKFGSRNEQLIEKLLLVAARVKLQSDFLKSKLLGVGVKKLAPGIRFDCMVG